MLLTWMEHICSYYRVSGLFTDTLWTKHLQKQIDPTSLLPNKVQNIPPRIGSGKEANRAVNFPIIPNNSIIPAPYCITLLLPTCRRNQDTRETTADLLNEWCQWKQSNWGDKRRVMNSVSVCTCYQLNSLRDSDHVTNTDTKTAFTECFLMYTIL